MDQKENIDAILACRVQGSRLYGKPLQPLGPGMSIIENQINSLKSIKSLRSIVLAIAEGNENYGFIRLAKRLNLPYFIGDEKDVLGRIIKGANFVNSDIILRVTTECPYILYEFSDELIFDLVEGKYDFATFIGPPIGTNIEIIRKEALIKSHEKGSTHNKSELVSSYIYEHKDEFKVLRKQLPKEYERPEIRFTVDYAEDLIFCQGVFHALKNGDNLISVKEIIKYWDDNPKTRESVEKIAKGWNGRLWE